MNTMSVITTANEKKSASKIRFYASHIIVYVWFNHSMILKYPNKTHQGWSKDRKVVEPLTQTYRKSLLQQCVLFGM